MRRIALVFCIFSIVLGVSLLIIVLKDQKQAPTVELNKRYRHQNPPEKKTEDSPTSPDKQHSENSLFEEVDISEKGFVMPALSKILEADSIQIRDYWIGLGGMSDVNYVVDKTSNAFTGYVSRISEAYKGKKTEERSNGKINIPIKAANKFLKILSNTPLIEKSYKPRITMTDDYPETTIELKVENESFVFWSKSQGEGMIPWGAKFDGKEYVANSDNPALALKELDPYLNEAR